MVGLLTPAAVDQSARMPRGVLSGALPAPAGWDRGGLVIPFYGCGEPVLRDKCVSATDVPNRDGVADFPAFPIEQSSACSVTGRDTLQPSVADRYAATSDWVLSRQLQTDQAGTGAPKLDDATVLGAVPTLDGVTTAVGCLEQAAADAGFGAAWVLHTTVRGASYLDEHLSSQTSPAGAPVIIGTGYVNPSATTVRFWVTGRVWASITPPDLIEDVARRLNNVEAWAHGVGVAAFDPCLNIAIDYTVPACPTPA